MPDSFDEQIPVETVRDLLGLARALYAALAKMGPGYSDQLFQLRNIGFQLNLALQRASEGGPGTFKHRAAWLITEKAIKDLAGIVDAYFPAQSLITATGDRVLKRRQ